MRMEDMNLSWKQPCTYLKLSLTTVCIHKFSLAEFSLFWDHLWSFLSCSFHVQSTKYSAISIPDFPSGHKAVSPFLFLIGLVKYVPLDWFGGFIASLMKRPGTNTCSSSFTTASCNLCHRNPTDFDRNNWVLPGCRKPSQMQRTALSGSLLSSADTQNRVLSLRGVLKTSMDFGIFPGDIHWCFSRVLHKLGAKITSVSGGYIAISMEREGITHLTPFSGKKKNNHH